MIKKRIKKFLGLEDIEKKIDKIDSRSADILYILDIISNTFVSFRVNLETESPLWKIYSQDSTGKKIMIRMSDLDMEKNDKQIYLKILPKNDKKQN